MGRKLTRKKIIKELDKLVIDIVRLRDNYTCQHCGKKVDEKNAHVSHVIPRSAGNKLRWDLQNSKVLCFHCHINWWHKNPIEATKWFEEKFSKRANYLNKNKGIKIYKTWELEILKEHLQNELQKI